ncbi:hypothetical protein U1Q18_014693, partial [Sarracenia purpurea var. burkii]
TDPPTFSGEPDPTVAKDWFETIVVEEFEPDPTVATDWFSGELDPTVVTDTFSE